LMSAAVPPTRGNKGPDITVAPTYMLDTHPEFEGWTPAACTCPPTDPPCGARVQGHFGSRVLTLGCETFELFDPAASQMRWVSATASGYHSRDPADCFLGAGTMTDAAMFRHALVVLHDLGTDPSAPRLLAKLYGADATGNATDVEPWTIGGRTYVFAADFGGRVLVFDVTDVFQAPAASIVMPIAAWNAPPNALDGLHENATEIEIDEVTSGTDTRVLAYVAFYRRGVVVLDVSAPASPQLVATLDTPGLAEGVRIRRGGATDLLVADRMGGVRIYAQRSGVGAVPRGLR